MTKKERFEKKIENVFKKDKLSKWQSVNNQFTLLSYRNNFIIKYDISTEISRDIIVKNVAKRMKKQEENKLFYKSNEWYRKCVYNTLNSESMMMSELKDIINSQPKEEAILRLNIKEEILLLNKKLVKKALSLFEYEDVINISYDFSKSAICICAMNDKRPFDYMIIFLLKEVKYNASATKDS